MSVQWDPLLTAATARELNTELSGGRARALLLDPQEHRLVLFMREHTLAIELHPLAGWISLLPPNDPYPGALSYPFRVSRVHSPVDETILLIEMRPVRGPGEPEEIVVELIGNRRNAVVVGRRSRKIRHTLIPRPGQARSLAPGSVYEPPTPTHRWGGDALPGTEISREDWERAVSRLGGDIEGRRAAVLRGVAWSSSLNVHLLLDPQGWKAWSRIRDPANWRAFLCNTKHGLQPYPVPLELDSAVSEGEGDRAAVRPTTFETLIEAFRGSRESEPSGRLAPALLVPPALRHEMERRLERAESRRRSLRTQLERLLDPDIQRGFGDLILARFSSIPRGASRVKLRDFEGRDVEIDLDPTVTPDENAKRYYQNAARSQRARETLPSLIRKADEAVQKWSRVLSDAARGVIHPMDQLLDASSRMPSSNERSGARGGRLPYRRFVTTGGLEVRVGRGAKQNDELTFHHSAPTDIWLHALQSAGAHVILRWPNKENPPRNDLAEAATLAALHSSARHSGSVPVAWTRRRHVRKPRGSAPGSVVPERTKTVFLKPDAELIHRLAADD